MHVCKKFSHRFPLYFLNKNVKNLQGSLHLLSDLPSPLYIQNVCIRSVPFLCQIPLKTFPLRLKNNGNDFVIWGRTFKR